MRRSLSFPLKGDSLVGTIDSAPGTTGVLIVTGGRQTRVGPHRIMATLAAELAQAGYPVFRFDRRGVGDSTGTDGGYQGSADDIAAAIACFRAEQPEMARLWAMGLCDGGTALALHHHGLNLAGLLLLNPWIVEIESGDMAPAAIKAYYRDQLLSVAGWRKLLAGRLNARKLATGVAKLFSKTDQTLAGDVMASLSRNDLPVHILLAAQDATARAFLSQYQGPIGKTLSASPRVTLEQRDTASHSFANDGDHAWLREQILAALG